jgi:hypothetical protein
MKSSRHILLRISIIVLIFAISVFGVVVYFVYKENRILSSSIEAYESARMREEQTVGLQTLLRSTKGELETLNSFVVKRSGVVEYLENLELVAREASLVPDVDSVLEEGEGEDSTLRVRINLAGAFDNLVLYLERLEVLPYTSYVESINMQYVEFGEWEMSVTLVSPVYVQDEEHTYEE